MASFGMFWFRLRRSSASLFSPRILTRTILAATTAPFTHMGTTAIGPCRRPGNPGNLGNPGNGGGAEDGHFPETIGAMEFHNHIIYCIINYIYIYIYYIYKYMCICKGLSRKLVLSCASNTYSVFGLWPTLSSLYAVSGLWIACIGSLGDFPYTMISI